MVLGIQIRDIYNEYYKVSEDEQKEYNKRVEIRGWVLNFRNQNNNIFIGLVDGSYDKNLQIVIHKDKIENIEDIENIRGATIKIEGNIVKSPAKGQDIEIVGEKIEIEGIIRDKKSVLLAKTVDLETLRNNQHLRTRFRSYNYIYKIRNSLIKNVHEYFQNNNFYNLDPNVITTSDCEGAGEVFTITSMDFNKLYNEIKEDKIKEQEIFKNDFFEKQAYLTVSSQLQLEALCAGLSRVYTLNPSFRAEKSKTKRHLGCFTHLEWEIAFIDINDLMNFSEDMVKSVIKKTLEENKTVYEELNKYISVGIIEKLENVINNKFERITYTFAIELIEEHKKNILKKYKKEITIKDIPKWGDDLGSYCEKYICDEIYKKPVLIYNYPKVLKSFYMKLNDDNNTVQACDLIFPNLGELIGSSIREDNYEKLINIMEERNMDKSKLQWYIDLRYNSTFKHGGAGLGFDRLTNFCCLMDGNIRDVVPFPVAFTECNY